MNLQSLTQHLNSKNVFKYFSELSAIPRASKKEQGVRDWLAGIANLHSLKYKEDIAGNIVIYKPAQNSMSTEKLLLQAHMDMVCEKDQDSSHNFDTDPIELIVKDGKISANKTTLGADNGIGLAMIIDILVNKNISHPDIEALFTIDEESGMGGVLNLDRSIISPTKYINLDSEEEGFVYIGCAGSTDFTFTWKPNYTTLDTNDCNFYNIRVDGLRGGHSGCNIHENRANSIKILTKVLNEIQFKYSFNICQIDGGNLKNAIPRFASCDLYFEESVDVDQLTAILQIIENKLRKTEPECSIYIQKSDDIFTIALSNQDSISLINLLASIHSGVLEMSNTINNLVQSSNNLSSVKMLENNAGIEIVCMTRSCDNNALEESVYQILSSFSQLLNIKIPKLDFSPAIQTVKFEHGELIVGSTTPGWNPRPDNDLMTTFQKVHKQLNGKPATELAIHAGLECGVLSKYYPELDIISFGPNIFEAHTPKEFTEIKSIDNCYQLLIQVLKTM
jgi:dipeptidase D